MGVKRLKKGITLKKLPRRSTRPAPDRYEQHIGFDGCSR
jgi:hypothetical protein